MSAHVLPGDPITAVLVRACGLALRTVPRANAAYRDGRFELYSRANVGLVVETEDGFVTPTLFDPHRRSVTELSQEIRVLTERAAAGELAPPELSGATFTLSDLGTSGIRSLFPIVSPSQAAAVAAGAIREVPVVRHGAIVPGHVMTLTLACDSRILYGGQAAAFLNTIKQRLEESAP
jgi:pyruvate dehydrogenase E2 component (dihydrolipoamide acetyltransferase)